LLGTIANVIAIIIGTLLGVKLSHRVNRTYTKATMRVLGIVTIILGVQMLMMFRGVFSPIAAVVLGGVIGQLLHIDKKIASAVGRFSDSNKSGKGFIAASVLFCIGPMSIIGSLEDGLRGNPSILLTKSGLDGVSSVVFGATFGIGVIFSALAVLALQGSITVLSSYAINFLTDSVISDLTATGGVLVLVIAANLLGIEKIKAENLLPSLLLAVLFSVFLT
jgi:uncharacterized membrane protein YqgA involved in biofilm formation